MLSTWRNRILRDIWFRNKVWWLSELPLPEPLRSPISPCDFLCTYFPCHNRPWLFDACNVVCLKGKTSCPLSPFPSSIWCPCLPAHHWPHKISLKVPSSPPASLESGPWGVLPLLEPVFNGRNKGYPSPAWCTANSRPKECFAFRWSAFKMQELLCVLLLSFPSPNVLCKF